MNSKNNLLHRPSVTLTKKSLLCVYLVLSTGCHSQADTKDDNRKIECPRVLVKGGLHPPNSVTYGAVGTDSLFLTDIGITLGFPSDSLRPIFPDEILEDWEAKADGTDELVSDYSGDRKDDYGEPQMVCLRCDYAIAGPPKNKFKRVVLIIKLDERRSYRCILKKNYTTKTRSGSCTHF
jgi:hypothetical protein